METRPLGPLQVTVVGLGCNNFGGRIGEEETRAVVEAALESGVTFFDTADIYGRSGGSEELLGSILEGRRERVVLATKFGKPMGDGAERVLVAAPRGGARSASHVRAPRDRVHPVLPARERAAHRQVPARREGDRGTPRRAHDPGGAVGSRRGAAGVRGGARRFAARGRRPRAGGRAGGCRAPAGGRAPPSRSAARSRAGSTG